VRRDDRLVDGVRVVRWCDRAGARLGKQLVQGRDTRPVAHVQQHVAPGPAGQSGRSAQVDVLGGGEETVPRPEHPLALLAERQGGQAGRVGA
jgi:hypothetical protein